MGCAAGTQPLRTVMTRLGQELEALQAFSETAQETVAALTGRMPPGPELSVGIQVLDALTQHLCALATFVNDLASAIPLAGRVDLTAAASHICLGRLRSRLMNEAASDQDDFKDIELF